MIPTEEECIQLLKKHAPNEMAFNIILAHVKKVEEAALETAKRIPNSNMEIIKAGSLLHDIGRFDYPPSAGKDAIKHGIRGAEILRSENIDESVAGICETHIGIGITKEDIEKQSLPLPKKDFIPITKEEKIIAYADNLVIGNIIGTEKMVEDRFEKELGKEYAERAGKFHNEIHGMFSN